LVIEVVDCVHFKLLSEPRFQCIEKIKTIGETYMAAAGIKPESQVSNKKNYSTKKIYFGWENVFNFAIGLYVLHTIMIRFSIQGAYLLLESQGRAVIEVGHLFGTRQLFLFSDTTKCSKQNLRKKSLFVWRNYAFMWINSWKIRAKTTVFVVQHNYISSVRKINLCCYILWWLKAHSKRGAYWKESAKLNHYDTSKLYTFKFDHSLVKKIVRGLSGLNFVRAFVVLDYDLLLTPSFVQKYFRLHVNSHKITNDHCICEQWRVSDFSFCKWKKQIQKKWNKLYACFPFRRSWQHWVI